MDIFRREVWKVFQGLGFGHTAGEVYEDAAHGNPGSLDAGLSAPNFGGDGNAILPAHNLSIASLDRQSKRTLSLVCGLTAHRRADFARPVAPCYIVLFVFPEAINQLPE